MSEVKITTIPWPYGPETDEERRLWDLVQKTKGRYRKIKHVSPSYQRDVRGAIITMLQLRKLRAAIVTRNKGIEMDHQIIPMLAEISPFIKRKVVTYNSKDRELAFANGSQLHFKTFRIDEDASFFVGQHFDIMAIIDPYWFSEYQQAYMLYCVQPSWLRTEPYPPTLILASRRK